MKGGELQFLLFFFIVMINQDKSYELAQQPDCTHRSNPALRATGSASYGATACAGVFTLWWRWPGTSCASRLWIRLRGLLGLRMDGRSMDPSLRSPMTAKH